MVAKTGRGTRRVAIPKGQAPGASLQQAPDGTRPKLPHEHDQSVGMTGETPVPRVTRQAYRDVTRGIQDTSRGDEAQEAYQKLKAPATRRKT